MAARKPTPKPQVEAPQNPALLHLIPDKLTPEQECIDVPGSVAVLGENVAEAAECPDNLQNALSWSAERREESEAMKNFAGLTIDVSKELEDTAKGIQSLEPIVRYRLNQKGGAA